MSNKKLVVEVVSACNLMPTDGEGSTSSFVELYYDGQTSKTNVKEKDLNPAWNERFSFDIKDPTNLQNLDVIVYHNNKATNSKVSLGRVRLTGTSLTVPDSEASVSHYRLEKKSVFSRVKGELSLKVYVTDVPSVRSSDPVPAVESFADFFASFFSGKFPNADSNKVQQEATNPAPNPIPNEKAESRHTFHHLPKENHHQQNSFMTTETQQPVKSSANVEPQGPQQPKSVSMYSAAPSQPIDCDVKETSPVLGGRRILGGRVISAGKPASTFDLVVEMQFLFVRVVKARDLPIRDISGSIEPYVEVKLGNHKVVTKLLEKNKNPEWNEVFAFAKDVIQSSVLEVVIKDKDFNPKIKKIKNTRDEDLVKDDFVGIVRFDLNKVRTRFPPDSPLAPEFYQLQDKKGNRTKGELMLVVWIGNQTDEAFPDAWRSDAATPVGMSAASITNIRSKVYHAPMLWYVRVTVLEAQDLVPTHEINGGFSEVYVKVQIGNQVLKTRPIQAPLTMSALWNEEMLFVTAEPFEEPLILSVEDRCKDEMLGRVIIPLNSVDKRTDFRRFDTHWFNLEKPVGVDVDVDELEEENFSGRLHLRLFLEGGYHVSDESKHYSSDLRPSEKQLWKPSIGVLELGILNAVELHPMKTRHDIGTSDTFCVAKYGHKWVRTRTIFNSLNPRYNEQYSWEVYDPATVLTVGVFDNGQLAGENGNGDMKIGKVRIRISRLENGRVYTHLYPLLLVHSSGVRKMGELHLAIRFSRKSLVNLLYMYTQPLLPKMHYKRPLTVMQLDCLRHHAAGIVAARLSRAEPPLRKEVVEYMSDKDSHLWSLRRSKANFFRLMEGISGLIAVSKWFEEVCMWKNPMTTVLLHLVFVILVYFPGLMPAAVFLYMFLKGIWNYRYRPGYPPHISARFLESAHLDELDEEFDTFPTSRSSEVVRMRYDRLRSIAGRLQTVAGDVACQMERIQSLLSWQDPPATAIFVMFCLVATLALYVMPLRVLVVIAGFYLMRHPSFGRHRLPGMPINFFRRLPDNTDSLL